MVGIVSAANSKWKVRPLLALPQYQPPFYSVENLVFNNSLETPGPVNYGPPNNVNPTCGPPTSHHHSPLIPSGVSIYMVQKFIKQSTYEPPLELLVFSDIVYNCL